MEARQDSVTRDGAIARIADRLGVNRETLHNVAYVGLHRPEFGVEPICRMPLTAPSTYYAARSITPSLRSRTDSTEAGIQRYPTFLGSGAHHYGGQATERRSIRKETADYAFRCGSRGVCAPLVLSMNSSARQTREE